MVARPPVAIVVDRMSVDDLGAVQEIERESFTTPWPPNAYRSELENNRLAHYIVARYEDRLVGFAGMWMMVDEAHITTFAVRKAWRRHVLRTAKVVMWASSTISHIPAKPTTRSPSRATM